MGAFVAGFFVILAASLAVVPVAILTAFVGAS